MSEKIKRKKKEKTKSSIRPKYNFKNTLTCTEICF